MHFMQFDWSKEKYFNKVQSRNPSEGGGGGGGGGAGDSSLSFPHHKLLMPPIIWPVKMKILMMYSNLLLHQPYSLVFTLNIWTS